MNKKMTGAVTVMSLLLLTLIACTKKDVPVPRKPLPGKDTTGTGTPADPAPPVSSGFTVQVKAYVEVGPVLYDSIEADITLSSFDSAGTEHKSELRLAPGTNTITLGKNYPRFRLTLHTWNVEKTLDYTREQLQEGLPVRIGAKRDRKTLRAESTSLFVQGQWRPQAQTDYHYNPDGSLNYIDYLQKRPQAAELHHYWTDRFYYNGSQVVKINRHDENNKAVVFTGFAYDANGFLQNISQDSYGNKTYASVRQGIDTEHEIIDVDYLFDNGNAMACTMKFRNGNKVSENATSSTGSGEGGNFSYDQHINPYHQLNWPDMYFRNSSKNNPVHVDKGYGGNIPSVVVYKTVYTYDADGYPSQVIKSYKGYSSGEHLYDQKTLYIY